jgi:LPS export ABC transporter protein LptC
MSSHTNVAPDTTLASLGASALRRMRVARFVGWAAFLAGLGVVGLFVFKAGLLNLMQDEPTQIIQTQPAAEHITASATTIKGVDQNGFAFTIASATATQDPTVKTVVHLKSPTGIFVQSAGTLNLSAATAIYNTQTKSLRLEGHVVFEQQGRYKAQMQQAIMDVNTMNLSSQSKVHVDLSSGSVDADHLDISENGKKTIFSGHVKANLQSDVKANLLPDVKSEIVP